MMKKNIISYKALFLTSITAIAISGCAESTDDLYAYIEQAKSATVGSVQPLPQFKPYESFAYSAAELRDPFGATRVEDEEESDKNLLSPDTTRPRQPLEAFPLDTLRMVGVLEQGDNLWGLIEDPKQVVHRVRIGNYMGQNEGHVTSISESEIFLVEIIPDGVGGYIERDASIAIGEQ